MSMTADRPTSSRTGHVVREQHAARSSDRDQDEETDAKNRLLMRMALLLLPHDFVALYRRE